GSHAEYMGSPRDTPLRNALYACDELVGFVGACVKVRPTRKVADLPVESVVRKLKDKAFARSVDRACIYGGAEAVGRPLEEHAAFVRETEKELTAVAKEKLAAPPPAPDASLRDENDSIPKLSRQQIELMVNSFKQDFARIASLQYTQSVGGAKFRWLGITEGQHELSHKPDKDEAAQAALTKINKWYCEELAYLCKRLQETPEPDGQGSLLDNTLIVWTNELGQGNSHTRNNIPFIAVGNGLDWKMGRSLKLKGVPHNRFLLSLAHGFGHRLERFGNPEMSAGGPVVLG
ncbi:MAG: DUF1552 domain-containing protein, partial [Planctomycetota bacterium]